uniref:Uncharacterized protein n=1 Tax=Caenorhabditis japonica TaxID=281687 RepID=A0A8R1EAJ9_CAEJA
MEKMQEREDAAMEIDHGKDSRVASESTSDLGGPTETLWARMTEEEVSIKMRRKLLKGFDEFLRNSVKVEKEVIEKLGFNTTCSKRTKSVVVEPLRQFGEELRGRWAELGGEAWMRPVMNVMRVLNADNADDLERSVIERRNANESAEKLK